MVGDSSSDPQKSRRDRTRIRLEREVVEKSGRNENTRMRVGNANANVNLGEVVWSAGGADAMKRGPGRVHGLYLQSLGKSSSNLLEEERSGCGCGGSLWVSLARWTRGRRMKLRAKKRRIHQSKKSRRGCLNGFERGSSCA